MSMSQEKWDALHRAFRERPGCIEYAKVQAQVAWRTARHAWEKGGAGRRALKEIIDEENAVRRDVLAESDEQRLATVAKIRDELMAEHSERMRQLDEREAAIERKVLELEAIAREAEARAKRAHAAQVESGRVEAESVRHQEALLCRSSRNAIGAVFSILALTYTPTVLRQIAAGLGSDVTNGMGPEKSRTHVRLLAMVVKQLSEAKEITARTERLVAGDPTSISELRQVITIDATDFEKRLVDLNRVAAQIRDGGKSEALEDAEVEPPALLEQTEEPAPVDTQRSSCDQGGAEPGPEDVPPNDPLRAQDEPGVDGEGRGGGV